MSTDRFWILLGKKQSGEATAEELQELASLMEAGAPAGFAHEVLDRIWEAPFTAPAAGEGWERVAAGIRGGKVKRLPGRPVWKRWLAAAGILLLAGAGTLFFLQRQSRLQPERASNNVITQAGSKSKIELPDGTAVWLNGSSRLSYSMDVFGKKNREVSLTGEAFFDVAPGAQHPFIIHTRAIDIVVLGTAFNVKAYPASPVVEAALVRGAIEITTRKHPDRKILLKPNEKFILSVDTATAQGSAAQDSPAFSSYSISTLRRDSGQSPVETVWMNSRLVFNEDSFEQLAPKLEAWFNIQVHFMDDHIKQRKFSGIIEKETLEQTLKALQLSYRFRYRIEGNRLWLGDQ